MNRLVREGSSWSGREANCAHLNLGDGHFVDISRVSGLDFKDDARALARVDWDGDGDLDLWIANRSAPQLRFMRNDSDVGRDAPRHALELRLTGRDVNRDAIGARVEARVGERRLVRVVQAGTGYISQSSRRVHIGLGEAERVDELTVSWPDGSEQSFQDLPVDQRFHLSQGEGLGQVDVAPRQVALTPSVPELPRKSERASIGLSFRVPFPRLTATTLDGELVELATSGRPTLVNLWASWCANCKVEMLEWNREREALQAAGLRIVALSVDEDEALARAFVEDMDPWFTTGMADEQLLLALETVQTTILDRSRPLPVPSSFLIDANGQIARIDKGPVELETLLEHIADLPLKGRAVADAALPFPGRWLKGPDFPPVLTIADRLVHGGHPRLSYPYYEQALERLKGPTGNLTPGNEGPAASLSLRLVILAETLFEQGHTDEGRRWLDTAGQLSTAHPRLWRALGAHLLATGDAAGAKNASLRATQLAPDDPAAWRGLAAAQRQLGEEEAALASVARALQLEPADG